MNILPLTFLALIISSCTAMPDFFKTADSVLTDDAITIKVDRDAIRDNTDISVKIDVIQYHANPNP